MQVYKKAIEDDMINLKKEIIFETKVNNTSTSESTEKV